MLLGITDHLHERNRISIKNRISVVATMFLMSVFLPFVIYALFSFSIIPSKSTFGLDVQEPVAKVITNYGVGTAFLINSTTLLTSRHVIDRNKVGDQVDLIFEHSKNQYQTKATIKFIAHSTHQIINGAVPADYFLTDVAVLIVSEISEIEPLVLGVSDAVSNLEEVILIGYPNGDYSITKGNINSDTYQGFNLFKLDATANPGNSGGPCILKDDNTVIGILVGSSAISHQGENIALKINDVKRILEEAKIPF